MATDTVTPLATPAQFLDGPFQDLARSYSTQQLQDILIEATRACETECSRRLAPFTGLVENTRAEGIDPDEYTDSANLPLDLQGAIGRSYAYALGASSLVRHAWVTNYAPVYQEYWAYNNVSILFWRSYGGNQDVSVNQILKGPDPDTGHLWFKLGLFLPIGSIIQITYDGGYQTVPADLKRACIYMAGGIVARDLDPLGQSGHSPDVLEAQAISWLAPYRRG